MPNIAFRILLALALILQGSVAAFGGVRSHSMHGPCCPQGMSMTLDDTGAAHPDCPCPSKQRCMPGCQFTCTSSQVAVPSAQFGDVVVTAQVVVAAFDSNALRLRADKPPIRPPIA